MKAITIKQPWATLISLNEKKLETRSWLTKHRGKIAIHAGKQIDKEACKDVEISKTLNKHGLEITDLPVGAIIAIADLTHCHEVLEDYGLSAKTTGGIVTNKEYAFGDFSEGRYAWELKDIKVLPIPIEIKGQLRLWEWHGN
ncbi:2-oxoglutarate dehydrogenase E1 [Lysinibacillus sphaericus]|uniref:ASCH domain-containing protein n=1 Tax=Lysinibacillus sphaericus TaxID=1421 RepID=UPI0018CE4881|nr:ASCH domain-containing protein [Lysinibacillus sphaericus]MBG9730810.1 2-oxoglutarate dehydrogenase E1 [Lysinibacillus sphaericus]